MNTDPPESDPAEIERARRHRFVLIVVTGVLVLLPLLLGGLRLMGRI